MWAVDPIERLENNSNGVRRPAYLPFDKERPC